AEMGRYGQKTGSGFHIYEKGNRTPIPDPKVIEIIEQEAEKLNITRAPLADAEIEQRCTLGLINEGAKILEEGIAYRPGDIDVIWSFGYGFPRFRGGPMYMADQIGSKALLAKITGYQERFGDYWKPAPLLEELARDGKTFAEWSLAR
ncbi:MAG: 3-hydroxyacyl-CoA dehydrogenase family protein, partial [Rhodospirillales bacterium]|nr:3-hydroxyacyl-CoA dehydrogenase family protein [Rhodospirillales bacterium]